jgi:hypothetical protein
VAIRDLPNEIKNDISSYVNCVSGAISRQEYENLLQDAGFVGMYLLHSTKLNFDNISTDISLIDSGKELTCCSGPSKEERSGCGTSSSQCCGPQSTVCNKKEPKLDYKPNEFVGASSALPRGISTLKTSSVSFI